MLNVSSYKGTHELLMEKFSELGKKTIEMELTKALGKLLSEDLYSNEDLPPFSRSTMDGYAVRAKDTFGASTSLPVMLEVAGKVEMWQYVE